MKSMMMKTTLREIKQSLGRYLAILAIVALGVGFFAGIKVTKPAMVETGDRYFKNNVLYDFRLISTLGFDDEIIQKISAKEDVRIACGAYSFDIICQNSSDGNMSVMKAHSITEGINVPVLISGRMPEKDNECVVDSAKFSSKYIGKKIKFSDSNEQEDLEHFQYKEYKIVGIVESPLYIQFERGSSALGNGKVNGFMYLLPESFNSEAYTEAYVKLKADYYLYDDEYDTYIEEKEKEWEGYLAELGEIRYKSVIEEGNQKLADARKELKEGKTDAEKEFADARKELENANTEIEDGKTKLEDARKEIEDGWLKLEKEEQKLAEAVRTIAKNEKLLLEKEQELEDGILKWQEGKKTIQETGEQLEQGEGLLGAQESQLLDGQQQLAESEAELIAGEEQLVKLEQIVKDGLQGIQDAEERLGEKEQEWEDRLGFVPEYIVTENQLQREVLARTKEVLLESQKELDGNRKQLEDGRKQLEAAKQQLGSGKQQLDSAKQQLEDGKKQVEAGNNELNTSWETIKEGRRQISDGRKELLKSRLKVEEGKREIKKAKEELVKGQEELEAKEQELLDGEKEYQEGVLEYEKAVEEYEEEIKEAEEKIITAQNDLDNIELPENYVLDRNTNVGYVMFQSDSDIVENVSTVFPIFFFLVAALVCMTTMSRMIEEQRTQIGTLKALGYSKITIMSKYLFYSGSAALIGCVGGYVIGVLLFPYVIWMCYGMMYTMGDLHFIVEWRLAAISLAVSLLCSMGTTWYSCRKELNEVSAQLMRPKTPQAGKRILLEQIPFVWKRLKFLQKVSIRNVFRYKKRFFMMVLGISGCAALVLAALGLKDSITNVMKMQYEEIQIFDMSIVLNKEYNEEIKRSLEDCIEKDMEKYCLVQESNVELVTKEETKAISMIIPNSMDGFENYLDMHTLNGDKISKPMPGEGVITHKVAEDYDIKVGDVIELQTEDNKKICIKVSGIMQNFVFNYVYIHPDTYRQQLEREPAYKTIYLNVKKGTDTHSMSATLMKTKKVAMVTINEDERLRFETMMSTLDYIILLVLLCAAALAFIVIYNLTNINITERIREIATIKVLGFYQKETATYVFRENIILTFVGAIVGLALGKVLHMFIMDCIKIDRITFDECITIPSYIYSVVLTLFFTLCINKLMSGKLDKVSMTESLKSVD